MQPLRVRYRTPSSVLSRDLRNDYQEKRQMTCAAYRVSRRAMLLSLSGFAFSHHERLMFGQSSGVPQKVTIARSAETAECTTGYLGVDGNQICYTLELPDNNNEKLVSRIPSGQYPGHLRYDHKDAWRIQLDNVPNRNNVQIHIGNWPFQTEGCILVGTNVDPGNCTLTGSADAYDKLRVALYGSANPSDVSGVFDLTIEITGL